MDCLCCPQQNIQVQPYEAKANISRLDSRFFVEEDPSIKPKKKEPPIRTPKLPRADTNDPAFTGIETTETALQDASVSMSKAKKSVLTARDQLRRLKRHGRNSPTSTAEPTATQPSSPGDMFQLLRHLSQVDIHNARARACLRGVCG